MPTFEEPMHEVNTPRKIQFLSSGAVRYRCPLYGVPWLSPWFISPRNIDITSAGTLLLPVHCLFSPSRWYYLLLVFIAVEACRVVFARRGLDAMVGYVYCCFVFPLAWSMPAPRADNSSFRLEVS